MPTSPSWDDDDADDEFESEDELLDEDETIVCPACGEQIYDDAPRCPYCGSYVTDEGVPTRTKPWWIIVTAAACLYLVYRWTVG